MRLKFPRLSAAEDRFAVLPDSLSAILSQFLLVTVLLLSAISPLPGQNKQAGANAVGGSVAEPHAILPAANYGKLPLSFEANQGQEDPQVRFLSHGNGYSLFLTEKEAVLALRKQEAGSHPSFKRDVVRMQLAGGNSNLQVHGQDKLRGTANYFIGSDPAQWHSGMATYGKVQYQDVYPGIDLVYYGNQQQLEYDFAVAPHADAAKIRLRFSGAKRLKLEKNGDLEVVANDGEIVFHKPLIYQEIAGNRHLIEEDLSDREATR